MDISDLLQGPMKDMIIGQVSKQFGIGDTQKAGSAVDGIFATLLNAVSKNASTPEGASGLMAALDRDHDGSILDDLTGFLSGSAQPQNPNTANGAGILNHLLGGNKANVADNISNASGLDAGTITQLMATLAPVLLGVLGKAKNAVPQQAVPQQASQSQGGGLLDFIQNATQTVNQNPNNQSLFSKLLDKDGDGNVMDDLTEMGMKGIFGKLLG